MNCTIDIDTGGTFTDGVYNFNGKIETVKVPTTPHDLTECFFQNLTEASKRFQISLNDLLKSTQVIRYGNTIGTNTIIQRNGPRLGVIVTNGNENSLYSKQFININDSHPMNIFVESQMVRGIDGRVDEKGDIIEDIDRGQILECVQQLIDTGARAIVICLVGSFYNSRLEQRIKKIIRKEFPTYYLGSPTLFLSSEVSDYPDEEFRVNTTIINAYIHREMARTLYKAEEKIRDHHYQHPLLIVHSNGGAARVAKTRAINTYHSGPTAGLIGAGKIGSMIGYQNVITADMGGTSLDIGFVLNGQINYQQTPEIEGIKTNNPMVRIDAIGAGGGSVVRIENGQIVVGPESAGAYPGPICFDRGGRNVTVTDANAVLGYLDPNFFLGGSMKLNIEKARSTIERKIANPLGISVEEAAWRIKDTVDGFINENIKNLTQQQPKKLEKGNTILLAYGGNGATHCVGFSKGLPIDCIVVSPLSSVFSAYGSSTVDVTHKYIHHAIMGKASFIEAIQTLIDRANKDMRGEGFSKEDIHFELEVSKNISNESKIVSVNLAQEYDEKELVQEIFNKDGTIVESIVINAIAKITHYSIEKSQVKMNEHRIQNISTRASYWGPDSGWADAPVYKREELEPGNIIHGPALIDAKDTTYVIPRHYVMKIDRYLNALIKEEA